MFLLYNLLFPLFFLVYLPYYLVHLRRRGGLTREYWQRGGFFDRETASRLRALTNPVWIHAVSVGETVAAISFIRRWQERRPEDSLVFSCSTSTAYATAKQKLPPGIEIIYCPIDFWWAIRRALNLIRPVVLVIFEVEIWPNLIRQAARRGAKVVLVNGRMSDRSSHGYAKWSFIFRPIFSSFSCLCVQTPEDASRIARVLGDDPRIKVCDTMKFDQVPDVNQADKTAALDACFGPGERVTLIAGSTHAGEEEIICDAYQKLRPDFPTLRLILTPRHCERTPEIEKILQDRGLTWKLLKPTTETDAGTADVLLVNTTGELMNFYGAADIAYVGKSLAGQTGGHNIIEPAIFGKAILHGCHMENFRTVAALFQQHQAAIELPDEAALEPALRRLLAFPTDRENLGRKARQVVERYRGAIDRTLDHIEALRKSA
ncbi:MAG TPA: 3-deoxy-D-manno-octulosonic acid transferase [Lentisphaeria bacterium]|nr:3-deoxy-D-manno-octulosonic acid transferase [Lentisphaeria bacterium]